MLPLVSVWNICSQILNSFFKELEKYIQKAKKQRFSLNSQVKQTCSYPARKQQVLTRHASQWNLLTVQGFFCGPVRKNSCLLDAEYSKFLPLDKRLELCKL